MSDKPRFKPYQVIIQRMTWVIAEGPNDAIEMAKKQYGHTEEAPWPDVAIEVSPETYYLALSRIPDQEGNSFGPDGSAWFYNDEYTDGPYHMNWDTGVWSMPEETYDGDWPFTREEELRQGFRGPSFDDFYNF